MSEELFRSRSRFDVEYQSVSAVGTVNGLRWGRSPMHNHFQKRRSNLQLEIPFSHHAITPEWTRQRQLESRRPQAKYIRWVAKR